MNYDLIDQANYLEKQEERETIQSFLKERFDSLGNDELKMALARELMMDQICHIIDKFPLQTQKEMLALITNDYLTRWAELEPTPRGH